MMSAALVEKAAELRRAVEQHAYSQVADLAVSFCEAAAAETDGLAAGDPRIREAAAYVEGVLEWSRIMLCTTRASYADELRRIPFLQGYLRQAETGAHMGVDV